MEPIAKTCSLPALLSGLVLAATAAATPASAAAQDIPTDLDSTEIACQKATFDATVKYLDNVFAARQDCFDRVVRQVLPSTVDCFGDVDDEGTGDAETDRRLQLAEDRLGELITEKCLGIDFSRLGFPGFCEVDADEVYTTLTHERCIQESSDELADSLLDIEHPPLPGLVPPADHNCQDLVARKASTMFVRELDTRTSCIQKQYARELPLTIDCRAEDDRHAPSTGDSGTDTKVIRAHNRVLRGIANNCQKANLVNLGFPHECINPVGSTFTIADVVECMFETHHGELIRQIDNVSPVSSLCGNGALDFTEQCDDGNNEFTPGDLCRANCTIIEICGDPNDDGMVSVQDALFLLRVAIGLESCAVEICDVNDDGVVTTSDVLILLQSVTGGGGPALACPAPIALTCGNGIVDDFEVCDDGDTFWSFGEFCNASCRGLLCGDPNDSGTITAQDAAFILRVAVQIETCDLQVCDVDRNGSVSTSDVLAVLRTASGQSDTPLVCSL